MPYDQGEFEALFQEHSPRLLSWLERRIPTVVRSRFGPADVLQEASVLALRKYPAFKNQAEVSAYVWLFGIVRDCYLKMWERQTRECRNPRQEIPWPDHSSIQMGLGLVNPGSTPSEVVAGGELQHQVLKVMRLLSADDMDLLAMRYWEDFSFGEIAAVLQIEETAARKRHCRALDRFHDLWQRLEEGGRGVP